MRFAFVDAEKAKFSIAPLCRTLQVSRSGYYAWLSRPASQQELDDRALLERISCLFDGSRRTYASPRVHRQWHREGTAVGHNRVARLMRENNLGVKPRKGYRNTTEQNEPHPVAPNVIQREFTATEPGQNGSVTSPRLPPGQVHLVKRQKRAEKQALLSSCQRLQVCGKEQS